MKLNKSWPMLTQLLSCCFIFIICFSICFQITSRSNHMTKDAQDLNIAVSTAIDMSESFKNNNLPQVKYYDDMWVETDNNWVYNISIDETGKLMAYKYDTVLFEWMVGYL